MATSFGGGSITVDTTQQALGTAREVDWLTIRTLKGADIVCAGATGVEIGTDFPILGGEIIDYGPCDLADVFVIGANDTDKLFFAWAETD